MACLTPATAQAYCRHARNREREAKVLHKFTEVAWKLAVHVFLTGMGTYAVLVQQPWFWDPDTCWKGYPRLPLPRLVYWYYMLEFGWVRLFYSRFGVDGGRPWPIRVQTIPSYVWCSSA